MDAGMMCNRESKAIKVNYMNKAEVNVFFLLIIVNKISARGLKVEWTNCI